MSEQAKTKAVAPIDDFRNNLQKMDFGAALPKQIEPEKFVRVALTAVQNNPDLLQKCDRKSLYSSCMRAAQDGLLPDGREGAIVPFGNVATWMPMIGGILKKIRNSGELASIASELVYEKDKFRYWVDADGQHLEHEPAVFAEDRGKKLGAYAVAKTKDGEIYLEVMSHEEIEKVRNVSRAKNGPAWRDWWGEMARKSVLRRLSKRLPMSTDIERLIRSEDEYTDFEQKTPETTKPKRLDQIVFGSDPTPPPPAQGDAVIEADVVTPEEIPEAPPELAEEDKLPFEKKGAT